MNEAIQGESSNTTVIVPLKRKRGRPRKDPSLKRVVRAKITPGSEQVPRPVDTVNDSNDGMIGQAVAGIVEATFGAGYLLNVRIGDSNTNFRGVVFKPGHFVPITAENDIAPHVQMIKRNRISLSIEHQIQVHRSGQTAELNGSTRLVHQVSTGKPASPRTACSVASVGARGTVVPVVLQPVNLTNGLASATQTPPEASQAAHMAAPKERGVEIVAPLAMLLPNGSLTNSQILEPTCEAVPSQTQVSSQEALGTGQMEDGSVGEGATVVQQEEVKPIVSDNSGIPVTEGIEGSPPSLKTDAKFFEASHESSVPNNSSPVPERDIGDMNELPSMEPSESVVSPFHTQAAYVSKPLGTYGIGRMTELLQAVQENLMENQVHRTVESTNGEECTGKKSPETDGAKE